MQSSKVDLIVKLMWDEER